MSYRNPQTVVDTESAKYYAQAISSIGQSTVKALNTRFARAQATKKANLKAQADLVKFSSDYLKDVNKSLKDFNITPQFRKLLDGEINKAAELRQQLTNINLTRDERLNKQNELNALETFFDAGLPNALENLRGQRDEISAKQVGLGQEGGLSASATNPQVLNDINDTFNGNPKAEYDFNITRDDAGALNVTMTFLNKPSIVRQDGTYVGEKAQTVMEKYDRPSVAERGLTGEMIDGKSVQVASKLKAKDLTRTYNLNSDFTPQSLIMNPVINKGISENLENEKITLNGSIDPNSIVVFGGEENGKKVQGLVDGTTIIRTVDKNNIVKEYEVDNLNIDRFKIKMLTGLKAQITGVMKQGRASGGDMGSGLISMQSWVDDILGEDIDLEPSAETDHGLTPESFKKLTDAILDKKHKELQEAMPRLREVGVEDDKEVNKLTANKQLEIKETNERLTTLKLGQKTPTSEGSYKITFNADLKNKINDLGFTVGIIKEDEDYGQVMKVTGANKEITLQSKGMTLTKLKKRLYLADGGKTSDQYYKNLSKKSNPLLN
jgi:hypothetical protein